MALEFTSGTYINHGGNTTNAGLDDIIGTYGGITIAVWVYPTFNTSNQYLVSKDNAFPSGWGFLMDSGSSSGGAGVRELRWIAFRGATSGNATDYISNSGAITLNSWQFLAVTHNEGDTTSSRVKLFVGDLSTPITDISSGVGYYQQQAGTAAGLSSDAGADLYVGNLMRNTSVYSRGPIARTYVWGSVLTEAQLRSVQFGPVGTGMNFTAPLIISDYYGASGSSGADFSGNQHNWTTNAAEYPHVPLRPRFGGYTSLTSTTAGTTPPPPAGQPGGGRVFWFM